MDYFLNKLEKLVNIASPSGNTSKAILFLREEFENLGLKVHINKKGALLASMDGKDNSKEVTLSAHVDTLGAMVKEIKSNGRLKISQIGGYSWNSIEGEYVKIETIEGDIYTGTVLLDYSSVHVHGNEHNTRERSESTIEIRLDEKVSSCDDVLALGINVGDFVSFNPKFEVTKSGFIKSRHLDDKAGVVSIMTAIKNMVNKKLKPLYKTHIFISNYEEVGHGAATGIPKNTDEFIAVDMAAPGQGQTSSEFITSICAKDSSGPYDYELRKKLINLCKEKEIEYSVDIYPFYGSDGSAALRAGFEFPVGLIGPGVDASHSTERTHVDAISNTVKLIESYLTIEI